MGKFCTKCGTMIDEGSKFCGNCGAKINLELNEINDNDTVNIRKESLNNTTDSNQDDKYIPDNGMVQMFLTREGRLNRARYLKRTIVLIIISCVIGNLLGLNMFEYIGPYLVVSLLLAFPQYCLDVRRLKDLNKDSMLANIRLGISLLAAIILYFIDFETMIEYGWYDSNLNYLMVIYLINLVITLYLLFADGTKGRNDYGPDPLGR